MLMSVMLSIRHSIMLGTVGRSKTTRGSLTFSVFGRMQRTKYGLHLKG